MSKGRKPTPPQIRLLEGTRPFNRTKPDEMAILCPGVPPAPPHLSGLALEMWGMWCKHLGGAKLLELIDAGSLEGACVAYARAVQADEQIKEQGITFTDDESGRILKNPACTVSIEAWAQYRHFALEFGGTPCARARLKLPAKSGEVDEFNEFVKKA